MKLKMIMAACAAICTTGAFAATPSSCPATPSTAADAVNNCAPAVKFYFGGASAQEPAVKAIMNAGGNGIFDTAKPIVRITSSDTTVGPKNSTAWAGFAKSGVNVGKPILVVYNKANGSGAGVLQVLTGKPASTDLESTTILTQTIAGAKAGTAGTCVITHVASPVDAVTDTAVCSTTEDILASKTGDKIMHLALSDVHPLQLDPALGVTKAKGTITATALQGFGLIVSPSLYAAMQSKAIAEGKLDVACTPSTLTAVCQPNVSAADYTGLITGSVKSADFLVGGAASAPITVARRVKFSGTQAASNIFFAGQAGVAAKAALQATDGFMDVIGTADGLAGTVAPAVGSAVTVKVLGGTGDVITEVSGNAGYAIGVVSTENLYTGVSSTGIKNARYVKVGGVSPDASDTGVLATGKNRAALQSGYPFQFQMFALQNAKVKAGSDQEGFAAKIIAALGDSTLSDLAGIAYTDAAASAAKAATYVRYLNNNYAPLVRK